MIIKYLKMATFSLEHYPPRKFKSNIFEYDRVISDNDEYEGSNGITHPFLLLFALHSCKNIDIIKFQFKSKELCSNSNTKYMLATVKTTRRFDLLYGVTFPFPVKQVSVNIVTETGNKISLFECSENCFEWIKKLEFKNPINIRIPYYRVEISYMIDYVTFHSISSKNIDLMHYFSNPSLIYGIYTSNIKRDEQTIDVKEYISIVTITTDDGDEYVNFPLKINLYDFINKC